jgi:hypothetical protein
MLRRTLLACLAASACAQPAWAQTRIYVSGDVFAEVTRFSRLVSPLEAGITDVSPSDGVSSGGGGRIGAFFSPEWSLELGVDLGKEISDTRTISVVVPVGFAFPPPAPQYQSRTSSRFVATSVLIGYHPPARGRAQAGFRGGLSVMRIDSTFTSSSISFTSLSIASPSPLSPPVIVPPTITVATNQIASIGYGMFATLGGEVAIDVSRHFAVVPEVRAHVSLSTLLVRPGVSARWRW